MNNTTASNININKSNLIIKNKKQNRNNLIYFNYYKKDYLASNCLI